MFTYSSLKETLKCMCCSDGWCYGVFWGFDKGNSQLLTLKDAYFEEPLGNLLDNMLLQVHAVGEGELGQAAMSQNHRWIYSDAYLDEIPADSYNQHDSDLLNQFTLGIKTIALISVESSGLFQFGSTEKKPEMTEFADLVRECFKGLDTDQELREFENERNTAHNYMIDQHSSFSYRDISYSSNQNFSEFEGLMEQAHSLADDYLQNSNEYDHFLLDSSHYFDCSGTHCLTIDADCSVQTSSQLKETSDLLQPVPCELDLPTRSCEDQRPYGLQTLDELFENDFSEYIMDDLRSSSPQAGSSSAELFSNLLDTELSSVNGLIPLSDSSGRKSPICLSDNFPTKSVLQRSITETYESYHQKKLEKFEADPEYNSPVGQNNTLIPVFCCDEGLDFRTNISKYMSEKNDVSRVGTSSNSLFSKLGLDCFMDGNYTQDGSGSLAAKRRKIDSYASIHSREKVQDMPSFHGKVLNPVCELETSSSFELKSDASNKVQSSSEGDDTKRQEESAKTGKKKAKPGTKPRPKDRQMIQDRLAELRQLVPNGEKVSIDRLLERTIKHLNYMQSLMKHAKILRQSDKPSLSNSNNGVTWACEVGDQSVFCPLIVEDLTEQGQMLIEIVYEEQSFFLQTVHILRSLGLIVLKGVMEDRESKIWARFIVDTEGNRRVKRQEIFSSLIQLLQTSEQEATDSNDLFGCNNDTNRINSAPSLFDHCEPSSDSFSVLNLANALASIGQRS